uniref:Uncharacterized protein n=1 Tax=Steinernema glaseri TaxID=37863 RepID=A0A1I7Y0Z5_9BILA
MVLSPHTPTEMSTKREKMSCSLICHEDLSVPCFKLHSVFLASRVWSSLMSLPFSLFGSVATGLNLLHKASKGTNATIDRRKGLRARRLSSPYLIVVATNSAPCSSTAGGNAQRLARIVVCGPPLG